MPKMKTVKAAAKRFKVTGSGKVKRNHAYATHLLKNKSTKRKRKYRQSAMTDGADMKSIKRMIIT
jgi:large subunit ribosomal protein L35